MWVFIGIDRGVMKFALGLTTHKLLGVLVAQSSSMLLNGSTGLQNASAVR